MSALPIQDAARRLQGAAVRQHQQRPTLTPHLVRDLYAYAERMLATEAGQRALADYGLDEPDIVTAYRLGYIPAGFRDALSDEHRQMLTGINLAGRLVLPAFCPQGGVVDLVAIRPDSNHIRLSMWDAPRGLCAPVLTTAHDHIVLTTSPRWIGRLHRTVAPTLFLRGVANAQEQAQRIADGGVCTVELRSRRGKDAEAIATILRDVGLQVDLVTDDSLRRPDLRSPRPAPEAPLQLVPSKPPAEAAPAAPVEDAAAAAPDDTGLTLISHDPQAEKAIFRCGSATYTVQIPFAGNSTVAVHLAVNDRSHRDRFYIALAPQRLRFARAAGLRTGLTSDVIGQALEGIHDELQALVQPVEEPVPAAPVPSDDAALALLRDPAVFDQMQADCDALGWVGEPDIKPVVLLAALSRLSDEPVWSALTATQAGERFPGLAVVTALTPPEHLIHVSRLTDNALFHGGPESLAHKLLVLDDVATLTGAALTSLKILHARGALTGTTVERDLAQGTMRTRVTEARGPLAVLTASTGGIPAALSRTLVELPVDESPAQAARLLAARQREPVDETAIINRWHGAMRLLRPLPVDLPADLAVPQAISHHRALQAPFFGLVAASALLHQYQRPQLDGRLRATADDVERASRAVLPLAAQFITGISARAQAALRALSVLGDESFTIADASRLMADYSSFTVRRALEDLIKAEFVIALRKRNGVRAEYRLAAPDDLCSFAPPLQGGCKGSSQVVKHA